MHLAKQTIKIRCTFVFLIIVALHSNAQVNHPQTKSKHQADLEKFDALPYIQYECSKNKIIPIQQTAKGTPTSTVFGYLPYWKYPASLDYLQYDLLSHIAVFDFDVSSTGNITHPPNWPWTDLINQSHGNGVKVVPCLVNFSGADIHLILNDSTVRQNLFNNTLLLIQQFKLDGVNVDFEGIHQSDRGHVLNDFMSKFTNFLHNSNPLLEVSFAGPAVNWGGWELEGLAASCDYIFIMAYNFWGGWSSTSGPCAPLIGGAYNLTNTILTQYNAVTETVPEKLILGIPYYGNRWTTSSSGSYADVVAHLSQPTFKIAMDKADEDGVLWDGWSETSWSLNSAGTDYLQTWFDTDSSCGLKFDLATQNQLKGVGIWALGYDGSRTELWDELRKHFGQPIGITENLSVDGVKVFPNPCRSQTKIEVQLTSAAKVNLFIYDTDGNLLSEIGWEMNLNAGIHYIPMDVNSTPPGIIYLTLTKESNKGLEISSAKLIVLN